MNAANYTELTRDISRNLTALRTHNADVMQGFGALAKAAMAPDATTKELIAMAIGVANRCDGCLGFHAKALVRLGATPEEFREMLGVAVYMGGGPSLMYAANAQAAYDEFRKAAEEA